MRLVVAAQHSTTVNGFRIGRIMDRSHRFWIVVYVYRLEIEIRWDFFFFGF